MANLTISWPFIGALLSKSVGPSAYGAGELVSYTIDLEKPEPGAAPFVLGGPLSAGRRRPF